MFILLLSLSFVFAANGWGDVNVGEEGEDVVNNSSDVVVSGGDNGVGAVEPILDKNTVSVKYTQDFYIALGVAGGGILLALLFIYLFLRSPKNKWKRKVVSNVSVVKKKNSKVVK